NYFPLMVGNNAFGGTFTARLMREIREKRGWSYGAYSLIYLGKEISTFVMRFYPAMKDTIPAIELSLQMLGDVAENGLKEDEVEFSKSYLINRFPFKIDTPMNKLRELVSIDLLGQPQDYLDKYVENVKSAGAGQVNGALKKKLSPSNLAIVIVGVAKELEPQLRNLKWVNSVTVQPYNEDFKF
ncbi:MAG: insulinase family protein, partial [Deltaproteobacteria bacterium]|nr:insulinase family protein [Deltaproteobacteria bacterium]